MALPRVPDRRREGPGDRPGEDRPGPGPAAVDDRGGTGDEAAEVRGELGVVVGGADRREVGGGPQVEPDELLELGGLSEPARIPSAPADQVVEPLPARPVGGDQRVDVRGGSLEEGWRREATVGTHRGPPGHRQERACRSIVGSRGSSPPRRCCSTSRRPRSARGRSPTCSTWRILLGIGYTALGLATAILGGRRLRPGLGRHHAAAPARLRLAVRLPDRVRDPVAGAHPREGRDGAAGRDDRGRSGRASVTRPSAPPWGSSSC
jgi:hypothetical protein